MSMVQEKAFGRPSVTHNAVMWNALYKTYGKAYQRNYEKEESF